MAHKASKISALPFLLAPISVLAGPPVAYDQWSVTNGSINSSASCANGVTCRVLAEDNGFRYEEVKMPSGQIYLRTLMTDPNAGATTTAATQLAFTGETYIPFALEGRGAVSPINGINPFAELQGIASKEVLRDTTGGSNFVAESQVQKSNMRLVSTLNADGTTTAPTAADMFTVKLNQSVTDADLQTNSFEHVSYTQFATGPGTTPDTDVVIGSKTDIRQNVNLGNAGNPNKSSLFDYRQRHGYMGTSAPMGFPSPNTGYFVTQPLVTASGTGAGAGITLGNAVNPRYPYQDNPPRTVTWVNAEDIRNTWLAQSDMNADGAALNYQNFSRNNPVTGAVIDSANQVEIGILTPIAASVSPFDWDVANLGTQPVFP